MRELDNERILRVVFYVRQTPYNPPSLEGAEMETCVTDLRNKLPQEEALSIHRLSSTCPFCEPTSTTPIIVLSVKRLGMQEPRTGNEKLYRARVSRLGKVEFITTDDLSLYEPQKFVFMHPWIRHIRGPSSGVAWRDKSESDTDSDSDSDGGTGPDEVTCPHFTVTFCPRTSG
ncbi:hypothetical protein EV401DRAFT_1456018 [Pisolithus croceorrhizus]|nr:hypothetical protein EV401DRAFT_1456018 [Pisolithus croceorrhizus]